MDSDAKAYKAAEALVLTRLAAQTVDVSVQCLPNPALQCGERVTVEAPQADGRLVPFDGEILDMGLSGSGGRVTATGSNRFGRGRYPLQNSTSSASL